MKLWSYLLLLQLILHANICFTSTIQSASMNTVETMNQTLSSVNKYGVEKHENSTNMAFSVDLSSKFKNILKLSKFKEQSWHSKWSKKSLTWSLHGHPDQLSFSQTASIMKLAFREWTDHIPMKIQETCSTCVSDITIDFVRGDHGDGSPFDEVGGALSHAFFPEDGRTHFDKAEQWNDGFSFTNGIPLYVVAVHAIGHALGLQHTFSRESIMYPVAQAWSWNDILSSIDRESIQNIYGHQFPSILKKGQHLNMNQMLRAPDGKYFLIMQSDGNLVLYEHSRTNRSIWESGTTRRGNSSYHAVLELDGNFAIYDGNQNRIWESGTKENHNHTFLRMEDDGKLVLYKNLMPSSSIWSVGTKSKPSSVTVDSIVKNYNKQYPNESIVAYKYKKDGSKYFKGELLSKVPMNDEYWLKVLKLSTTTGESMTSNQIKKKLASVIGMKKKSMKQTSKLDNLYAEIMNLFPNHRVNMFVFNNIEWSYYSKNTKGSYRLKTNDGSEIDIVLS